VDSAVSVGEKNEFEPAGLRWLDHNLAGVGVTSFLSDAGHELATTILPGFLAGCHHRSH
jgi:hypothetical protein